MIGRGLASRVEHKVWPGIFAWWGLKYNEHKQVWPTLFDVETSEKNYEEVVEGTGFGLVPIKPEGASISYDTDSQGATTRMTHVVYGMGWIATQEELEDNLYTEVAKRRTERLAFSLRCTDETVHANIFNRAFNSSYTGGDGKELCATDHPTLDGTQSNELATAADLSEASLEDMCVQIYNAKNSRGLFANIMPKQLVVPPALIFDARRILESSQTPDTANNAKNVVADMFDSKPVMWQYLSDTDAWFVKTDAPTGLMHFWRRKPAFSQDSDFETSNAKAKVTSRYIAKHGDWRSLYGTPGA